MMDWTRSKPSPQRIDLEAKSDRELLIQVVMLVNDVCGKLDSQNGRVTSLEHWRAYLTGAIVVLSALVGTVSVWALGKI